MWSDKRLPLTLAGMPKPKGSATRKVLAENLRVERARRRMSQERLAELAGVSRVYLGTIERGNTACSIDIVDQLASALDVPVPELLSPTQRTR